MLDRPRNLRRIGARHQLVVNRGRRRARAKPETIDRLQRHIAGGAGLAHLKGEHALDLGFQRAPARRLTRFRRTQPDDAIALRRAMKIRIETDNAFHIRARQIEKLGRDRLGVLRQKAARFLHGAQGGDQPAYAAHMRFDNGFQGHVFPADSLSHRV